MNHTKHFQTTWNTETYLEPCQTFMMEPLAKLINLPGITSSKLTKKTLE